MGARIDRTILREFQPARLFKSYDKPCEHVSSPKDDFIMLDFLAPMLRLLDKGGSVADVFHRARDRDHVVARIWARSTSLAAASCLDRAFRRTVRRNDQKIES